MILGVISLYFLAKHRKIGFVFGIMGSVAWMVFAILAGSVANILANLVYVGFNIHCWRQWKEDQSVCPRP